MVTFISKNSSFSNFDTLIDVPKGSATTFQSEGDQFANFQRLIHERDDSTVSQLSELLVQLGIKDDSKKMEAFLALVKEVKGAPKEGLMQRLKASKFVAALGLADASLSFLASAVSIASELLK